MFFRISPLVLLLGGTLLLSSCDLQNKKDEAAAYQTVSVDQGGYSLTVPKSLYPIRDLNPEASLQYGDSINQFYVIVLDEPKSGFVERFSAGDDSLGYRYDTTLSVLQNYRAVELKMMQARMPMKAMPEIRDVKINGLNAEVFDYIGSMEMLDADIYYKTAFIEGPNEMYVVMAWTYVENQDKLSPEFDKVVNSFKLK